MRPFLATTRLLSLIPGHDDIFQWRVGFVDPVFTEPITWAQTVVADVCIVVVIFALTAYAFSVAASLRDSA